ncbi:hypothetical protein PG990_003826 [Apiospora arundinis]
MSLVLTCNEDRGGGDIAQQLALYKRTGAFIGVARRPQLKVEAQGSPPSEFLYMIGRSNRRFET